MNHCSACAGAGHRTVETTEICRSCGGGGHVQQYQQPTNRNTNWVGGANGVTCHDCGGQGRKTVRQYGACPDCSGMRGGPDSYPGGFEGRAGGGGIVLGQGFFDFLAWVIVLGLFAWGGWSGWTWISGRFATSSAVEQRAALEKRGVPYLTGQWSGRYTCAQGATAVRLLLTTHPDGTVDGRFEFSPYAGGRGRRGAFQVAGEAQAGTVTLRGGSWIDQPPGYQVVDVRVALVQSKTRRLEGKVLAPGCGAIALQEVAGP